MRLCTVPALVLVLGSSAAALADPPMGTWVGDHRSITFTLSPDGTYVMPPSTSGTWSWNQTGTTGGIITFYYDTPTYTQTFHNKMYFSIEFINSTTATLTEPTHGLQDIIRKQ